MSSPPPARAAERHAPVFEDFESIHSDIYIPPAEPVDASRLSPGSVVEVAETQPSPSSLELGLMQRAANKDPEVCRVLMRETKTIDIEPGQRREMFTFGLGSCGAVSVVSKQHNGKVCATMSHQPPEELESKLREIEQGLARHPAQELTSAREVLVLMPGGYQEVDGKLELRPTLNGQLARLLRLFESKLPETVPTRVTYHPNRPPQQSDALVIEFPAKAEDQILYKGIHNAPCAV